MDPCIIVLDKENAAARKSIFMIDASKAFIKDGNKNRLRAPLPLSSPESRKEKKGLVKPPFTLFVSLPK